MQDDITIPPVPGDARRIGAAPVMPGDTTADRIEAAIGGLCWFFGALTLLWCMDQLLQVDAVLAMGGP